MAETPAYPSDERFGVLAEQVDRRVRKCRPLEQEQSTVSISKAVDEQSRHQSGNTRRFQSRLNGQKIASECFDIAPGPNPRKRGGNSHA